MSTPNTDLLPPLFDRILDYYGESTIGARTRADIIKALENGIVIAAADHERAAAQLPDEQRNAAGNTIDLTTFDRLSGDHLSRAALCEELQTTLSLGSLVIEIAVLLVEAQIDLRLKAAESFKLAGIEFARKVRQEGSSDHIARWCQDVLESTLQGSQSDVPTLWNRVGKHRPEGLRVLVESLQLSATLRDALPYTIKVDKRLVDPLLTKSRAHKQIRLLHISDLHLVEDLTDPQRGGSPTIGQLKHSFDTVRLLGRSIDSLQPRFDMLVATGDLTTDGSPGAFETVLQYVRSGPISGENKARIAAFGLNAGQGCRLLLPGNHDRFEGQTLPRQINTNLFEKVLETPDNYPYVRGFRPPGCEETDLTLLLFVFDSTLTHENEPGFSRIDAIAQGIIKDEEISKLVEDSKKIAKEKKVKDLDNSPINFCPGNTIRIALLHHHPVVKNEAEQLELRRSNRRTFEYFTDPLGICKSIKETTTKLRGADNFLRGCFRAGIQLILFGHHHHRYRRAVVAANEKAGSSPFGLTTKLRAFCCPTTLELSNEGNGFYLFDFIDKDTVSLDVYVSLPSNTKLQIPFNRIAQESGKFKLCELSTEEAKSAYTLTGSWSPERDASVS